MANWRLRFDRPAASELSKVLGRSLVYKTTRQTLNRSQILVPVDTGYLRTSATSRTRGIGMKIRGTITYTARYAAAVHNGRRALTIRAKRKKSLKFIVDGEVVYARSVHQKARRGRPYLYNALNQVAGARGFKVEKLQTFL